jgi:hypothetical protein
MLFQIKYIVHREAILYDHIHRHVVKKWDNLNAPLLVIAYVPTLEYYSPSWLAQPTLRGWVRRKPHIDLEVQSGYMLEKF